ncbi:ArsR/SmtB family transcription factor [Halopenitus persicus]|uniref:ArsR/SmtB family transcription factor n=1 Tax=Halopenitus persicus TaxID=1048396 RepID=UPI000BBA4E34|nr:metalloregulator ArsR/SmtB family transcription factor [Halopenitus persicus]
MAHATQRLRRYLEDELEECRSEDVDRRLAELGTLEAALGGERVEAELDVLSALAAETRYTLARVLVAAEEELCVCELNAVVDVSESGLSHALSTLADAGLVTGRTDGRWRKYRATNRAVALVTVLEGCVDADTSGSGDDPGAAIDDA